MATPRPPKAYRQHTPRKPGPAILLALELPKISIRMKRKEYLHRIATLPSISAQRIVKIVNFCIKRTVCFAQVCLCFGIDPYERKQPRQRANTTVKSTVGYAMRHNRQCDAFKGNPQQDSNYTTKRFRATVPITPRSNNVMDVGSGTTGITGVSDPAVVSVKA